MPTPQQLLAWVDKAPDRGLLWRISRDGRSSYLFGSLHVGRADWIVPGPALRAAWADTDVLAVELDPADVMPALAKLPPPAPLPEKLARRMQAQAQAACVPDQTLAALPLMLQLSTLTLFEARRDGLDAAFGQEMMLLGLARAQGRPVQSLESVDEQLAALSGGEDELALVDSGLRQLQQGQVRAPLRRLAETWSRGDLAALADYRSWCRCADTPAERAWIKRLNDDRNLQLAERIDALHAAGQRLFVAVGALHMSGPQALPKLLAARGFEVQTLVPARPSSK
jgi:uncharacterized protein YbaP (TraB family)